MLDGDSFGISGANYAGDVNESASHVTIFIDLFTGEVSFSRKSDELFILDIADDQDRLSVVLAEDLVNFDIILLDLGSCTVPTDNLLSRVDAALHFKHVLKVDVIKEINIRLIFLFFKGDSIAVSCLHSGVIRVFSKKDSYNTLLGALSDSSIVINDRK